MTSGDPYAILGVERDAGEAQIKKAFRGLARELHPDVNPGDPAAEGRFKEAAEAYEILSDPSRRATYDRFGHEGLRSTGQEPHFDGFGSISDLFGALFGAAGGAGAARGPAVGGDVAAALEMTLAETASGGAFEVSYEVIERCEHCRGNGAEPGTPIETCSRCRGAGRLQAQTRTPFGQMTRAVECDQCGGDGRIARTPCRQCRGRGRRVARRKLSVDVPAGIDDGQRIRVSGRGHAGDPGAPDGDLYVLVRVAADERFVREGDDLICVVDVPAPQAALGATLRVPTLAEAGEEEVVEIAPGTQPGEVVVLRGRGMPRLQRAGHGDLRVVVNVQIPRRLTHEQRELVEQLAASMTDENLRTDDSMFSKLRRALRPHAA
ncbi:MAG: molecular chaperone DnaJ [Solirubrobacteraceae bacterium]